MVIGGAFVGASATADTRSIELAIETLQGSGFIAKAIRIELSGAGLTRAQLRIGEIDALNHRWLGVTVTCSAFRLERSLVECRDGRLDGARPLALSFSYNIASGSGVLSASPDGRERWEAEFSGGAEPRAVLKLSGAAVARLHDFALPLPVKLSAGTADGVLQAAFGKQGVAHLEGEIALHDVAFSDAAGLHAGDGIGGKATVLADATGDAWQWRIDAAWPAGEVYWDPVYSKAGYRLTAAGELTPRAVEVERATLAADEIGELRMSASLDRSSLAIAQARAQTGELAVAPLYARFLKPVLGATAFAELRAEGQVRASAAWRNGRLAEATLDVDDVSVEDTAGRFALFGVYASLPWKDGGRSEGRIGMSGAELHRLPLGAVGAVLDIGPQDVRVAQFGIPVLSGLLSLSDLAVRDSADGLTWEVRGALSPVPLDVLLAHFGAPAMQGSIAADIPRVRYERSTLQVDGALAIQVFDGSVTATRLEVQNPLGLAPTLQTSLAARGLDLGLVTRAFSFGNITGKVDARIDDLVLSNWRPVGFDARIESSPGDYPKRISQTAVSNISALGGAGATAAIERSVLRLFDTFGYSRLGVSCRLQNGVCTMGGIEDLPQGYVLVKGGGVPSISVLGYNREVGWDDLLTRLRRVIDSNVKPTIK